MGLVIGKSAGPATDYVPTGRPRGRPKKNQEEPEAPRPVEEVAKNLQPNLQQVATSQEKTIERPYKSPAELRQKIQEYVDSCHSDYDWEKLLDQFVELKGVMIEHPTWSNHEKKFRELIAIALTSDVFPDEAGLRTFLGLDHASYYSYKDDPEYESVFNWAQDVRESWAARRLAAEPRAAQSYLTILKQSANGGWVDRKTDQQDKTLAIKIADVGGKEAFG